MPYLYCDHHGKQKLINAQASDDGCKIAAGIVHSDFLCDHCNKPINPGDIAYYLTFYPNESDSVLDNYFIEAQIQTFPIGHRDEIMPINPVISDSIRHYYNTFD